MKKIPRTMSTQHPDNINRPLFSSSDIIGLDEEVKEAPWAYSMGIDEQMWDFEGKKTAPSVVSELLTANPRFFKKHPLGQDNFLTFRIPNPDVEITEAKLVFEILESIPRSFDKAESIYGSGIPPIFEVILPMASSAAQLNRIYYYYRNFVVGRCCKKIFPGDITVGKWLGEIYPKKINVIPLFEEKEPLLDSADIVREYLKDKKLGYQRVFLARSDPSLNYGNLAAVLLLNVALQRLHALEKETGIGIYPILGIGSAPFRGNFKPEKIDELLTGYGSCQTFSIQSSFKYDYKMGVVAEAVKKINAAKRTAPMEVDEEVSINLINRTVDAYQSLIPDIAKLVARISPFIPKRRLRRSHSGRFGYARSTNGVSLPRAITYCASLYSIGLPPEILGLDCLDKTDIAGLKDIYPEPHFTRDLQDAMRYFNPDSLSLLPAKTAKKILRAVKRFEGEKDCEHKKVTSEIIRCLNQGRNDKMAELIEEAGRIRNFLG